MLAAPVVFTALATAQTVSGTRPGASGPDLPGPGGPGPQLPKPGGGTYFLDRHRAGQGNALFLEEIVVGRLVDVHGLDASGAVDPAPVFRDFLVGESIQDDGVDYRLVPSASTLIERLIVLRRSGTEEFAELVRAAEDAATPLPPHAFEDPLVATVPRNATLSLHFGD